MLIYIFVTGASQEPLSSLNSLPLYAVEHPSNHKKRAMLWDWGSGDDSCHIIKENSKSLSSFLPTKGIQ